MWEIGERYRRLVVVGYNTDPPKPGNGSCIFLHVWRSPGAPTSGCTAMELDRLEGVMTWLRPEENPALVQLPREVYGKVWKEWHLPDPALLEPATAHAELVD